MITRILYIVLLTGCMVAIHAQPVFNISASKNTIRTGEPDTLTLTASWPGHALQQGFTIADTFPHFEVWDKGTVTPLADGISQTIVVTGYDSGRFSLPPLPLAASPEFVTDSFPISIEPVNVDTLQDYHDIKDIIEVEPVRQWPFIVLIALLTIAAITVLYFVLKRKGHITKVSGKNTAVGAYERAMEGLGSLEKSMTSATAVKPFFTQLIAIYRTYLSEDWQWRSQQQTGGELILQARPLLTDTDFYELTNSIRLSDAVKFAKFEPGHTEWQTALTAIRKTIRILHEKQETSRQHQAYLPKGAAPKTGRK